MSKHLGTIVPVSVAVLTITLLLVFEFNLPIALLLGIIVSVAGTLLMHNRPSVKLANAATLERTERLRTIRLTLGAIRTRAQNPLLSPQVRMQLTEITDHIEEILSEILQPGRSSAVALQELHSYVTTFDEVFDTYQRTQIGELKSSDEETVRSVVANFESELPTWKEGFKKLADHLDEGDIMLATISQQVLTQKMVSRGRVSSLQDSDPANNDL